MAICHMTNSTNQNIAKQWRSISIYAQLLKKNDDHYLAKEVAKEVHIIVHSTTVIHYDTFSIFILKYMYSFCSKDQ